MKNKPLPLQKSLPDMALKPGSIIGILGGGQLGRMTAMAAAQLGYNTHIYSDTQQSPAAQVSTAQTVADYTDENALRRFAAAVDVITFEFENIPAQSLVFLEKLAPVSPSSRVLAISQDRIREKTFLNEIGAHTASWRAVRNTEELEKALAEIGAPAILKTARMGYDGKGQIKIDRMPPDAAQIWRTLNTDSAILEGFVDFDCEISVIVCRGKNGQLSCYPPTRNIHKNHILHQSIVPANIPAQTSDMAITTARKIAQRIELVGVMGVEMFVDKNNGITVNELAPRPHNSGHWTLDACRCSQFEQLVRAIAGLPPGETEALAGVVMTNLIGEDVDLVPQFLKNQNIVAHLYGKPEARPGRKMGHITEVLTDQKPLRDK